MRIFRKIPLKERLVAFPADRGGSVAILFGLLLIVLLMAAGVAVDYARAAAARTALQNELDAAVLAGVRKDASERRAAAEAMFDSYPRSSPAEVVSRTFSSDSDQLTGEAVAKVPTAMLAILRIDHMTVRVASAAKASSAAVCILVKNPSASQALLVNSGANIVAPDCEMHVRSTASPAAMINNGQGLNLQRICVKSPNVTQNGGAVPGLETDCDAIDDPFAGKLPKVTVGSLPPNNCSSPNFSHNGNNNAVAVASGNYCGGTLNGAFRSLTFGKGNYRGFNIPTVDTVTFDGGSAEGINFNGTPKTVNFGPGYYKGLQFKGETINLSPGTYDGVTFNSGTKTVNLAPGLYIWKGKTTLNSGLFKGKDVTIYFPDRDSNIVLNSGAALALSAPASGTYGGILMFEPDGLSASSFNLNGSSQQELNGLIYWPSREITVNSTSTILSDRISLVVDRLRLNDLDWHFSAAGKGMHSSSTGPARLLY